MAKFSGSSIASIVISLIIIAILIWNVVYIGSVRTELAKPGSTITLSASAANIIFWIDIILIVMVILYLIYNIFVIFSTVDERQAAYQSLINSQAGYGVPLRQYTTTVPTETIIRPAVAAQVQ